jgi:hypothetical protein
VQRNHSPTLVRNAQHYRRLLDFFWEICHHIQGDGTLMSDLLVLGGNMVAADQEFLGLLQHRRCHKANRDWLRGSILQSKKPSALLRHLENDDALS